MYGDYRMSPKTADTTKELVSNVIQVVQGFAQQYTTEPNARTPAGELLMNGFRSWSVYSTASHTRTNNVSFALFFQLVEDAGYWWVWHEKTMTPEQQVGLTWEQFKQIVTRKYIPSSYFYQKETEFFLLSPEARKYDGEGIRGDILQIVQICFLSS